MMRVCKPSYTDTHARKPTATERGFAPFVACFLCILQGLGGTLVLLAVYHKALPALPISIFLSVAMFLLVVFVITPWLENMWTAGPYYV